MPKLPAALCLAIVTATAASQRPPSHRTCSLQASITDEDGNPIRAYAMVRTKHAPAANLSLPVSTSGQIRATLEPTFYDLFVSAPGFQPLAQTLDLRSCHASPLNLTLFFNPDEHRASDSN